MSIDTGVSGASWLGGTRMLRGFGAIDATTIEASAKGRGERLVAPSAEDDKEAVETAVQFVRDAGWKLLVVGGLSATRSFRRHGRTLAAKTDLPRPRVCTAWPVMPDLTVLP